MYDLGDIVRPTMSLNDESSPPEVAIVGAGLAGLSAALTLRRHAKHVRVSILEKESRIGGRVLRRSDHHDARWRRTPASAAPPAAAITPALRALLERRLEFTRPCERTQGRIIPWVFHRKGQPVKTMTKSWRTACKNAGVPGRLLHDLRRTAVRNLERATVSRSVAMKMTGHKTESVYRRYAIVSEGDLREAGCLAEIINLSRSYTSSRHLPAIRTIGRAPVTTRRRMAHRLPTPRYRAA
jgi:hypothetical protein